MENKISTNDLAKMFGISPKSIYHSYCQKGHWLNMKPIKLPNNRLLWDLATVNATVNSNGD